MDTEDLNSQGLGGKLTEDARAREYQGAERVYRSVPTLRDGLPSDVQMQVALMLEWARVGLDWQISQQSTPELVALHAAYTYARDVLIGSSMAKGG